MSAQTDSNLDRESHVRRNLLCQPGANNDPIRFRSWTDQAIRKKASPAVPTKKKPQKPKNSFSLWRSRDFQAILGIVLATAVASVVYFIMKGS